MRKGEGWDRRAREEEDEKVGRGEEGGRARDKIGRKRNGECV